MARKQKEFIVDPESGESVPVKKPRKPRTPKAPTFSDTELLRFATHTAADLKAARADENVTDEELADLFVLNKKLKAMTDGGA